MEVKTKAIPISDVESLLLCLDRNYTKEQRTIRSPLKESAGCRLMLSTEKEIYTKDFIYNKLVGATFEMVTQFEVRNWEI
jgi:hypothetical protein